MVKCGDDIIVFDSDLVDLTRQGFTALGHRSPLAVAHTHGVFCLSGRYLFHVGAHVHMYHMYICTNGTILDRFL